MSGRAADGGGRRTAEAWYRHVEWVILRVIRGVSRIVHQRVRPVVGRNKPARRHTRSAHDRVGSR